MPEERSTSRLVWPAIVATLVVVLDQLTKELVRSALALHAERPITRGELVLALVHGRNPGIGFSVLSHDPPRYQWLLLSALSFVLAALLLHYLRSLPPRPLAPRIALTLILGGATSNLVDRVRFGYVTDFVRVGFRGHYWPDFNVADAAISVGAVLLLLASLWRRGTRPAQST